MIRLTDALPPKARAKWAGLAAAVDDSKSLLDALMGRRREAEREVMVATQNFELANPKDLIGVARLERAATVAREALAAIEREQEVRAQRMYAAMGVLSPIQNWFASLHIDGGPVGGPVGRCSSTSRPRRGRHRPAPERASKRRSNGCATTSCAPEPI
jgi:hypothetical protein